MFKPNPLNLFRTMKYKFCLLGILMLCLYINTGDSIAVSRANLFTDQAVSNNFYTHHPSEIVEIPSEFNKIKIKKFKRFRTKGLTQEFFFVHRIVQFTAPEFNIDQHFSSYSEFSAEKKYFSFLLRGPPACLAS